MSSGKKIAVFSLNPLFPDFSSGGNQAQLKKVALHLGELGHQLSILTTRREGSMTPFKWHDNVAIQPVLRFKQPFPEPYFTPIYHIANAMRAVGDAIAAADVHYSHDGGLIFPYVYQTIPTVISLRSIIYPETLQSAFLFQGDEWILPSEHTRASYEATVGQFAPQITERMHAVHNGFDWDVYRYTKPDAIFALIPPDVAERPALLFPHRPEAHKGIDEVVQVARNLVYQRGWRDLIVLAPRWLDADAEPSNRDYYDKLRRTIAEAGLNDVFVFHDWIPEVLIAEYYSLADLTMCIGSCVETFGNTPFESLGCGTPALVARVATYRDLLPDQHIKRVDYGDIEAATQIADAVLRQRRRTSASTLAYLRSEFSLEAMVGRYAELILNARKRPPLTYRRPVFNSQTRYQIAPWCCLSPDRGVYHDFRADYRHDDDLERLTREQPGGFPAEAVAEPLLRGWLAEGYVVPAIKAGAPQSTPMSRD